MSLTNDLIEKVMENLDEQYGQVSFFQDQVVITDDEKTTWDTAIEALDSNLLGQIQIVNRAIDDVKDAYQDHFTGVTSCRSDLFWMATNFNDSPTPSQYTFTCVKLNENGYTGIVNQLSGNLVGVGSTFFYISILLML